MRMIVIKHDTDLQGLATQLLANVGGKDAAFHDLQRLNPHVDFKHIEPGTVLLVPDQPGLKNDATTSIAGASFDEFRGQAGAALEATVTRVRQGYEVLIAQGRDVSAVLKTAAVKRLVESNTDVKPLVDAAAQVFKEDQQQAKEAEKTLKALQEGSLAELGALAKMLS